jgi:hypothetical protein
VQGLERQCKEFMEFAKGYCFFLGNFCRVFVVALGMELGHLARPHPESGSLQDSFCGNVLVGERKDVGHDGRLHPPEPKRPITTTKYE